jgi:hypothetical protein
MEATMSSHERYKAYVNKPNESFDYPNMTWKDWQAAYAAGQETMRERAAKACDVRADELLFVPTKGIAQDCAEHIRALPIED